MATKIKVKKITDLAQLPAEDTIDIWSNVIPGAQDEDQIIVAHNTNVNDEGGSRTAVMHTNTMQLGELLKYIDNRLNKKYMYKIVIIDIFIYKKGGFLFTFSSCSNNFIYCKILIKG